MEHQSDKEFVDEQPPASEPRLVGLAQIACEVGAEPAHDLGLDLAPDDVVPDRQPIVSQVAPGLVELDVPVVQIARVGGLERRALKLEGDHQRKWKEGESRESRVVFIGRELPEQMIRDGFESCIVT